MSPFARDLGVAARSLLRSPVFLASSAAILATVIGANTALFSLVYALLWKPIPFPEPERLATANAVSWNDAGQWVLPGGFAEDAGAALTRTWLVSNAPGGLGATPGVEQVAAAIPIPMAGRHRTRYDHPSNPLPRELQPVAAAAVVSSGYFRLLRIPRLEGRDFTSLDSRGQPPVIVISRSLAEREFAGRSAVGQRLRASFTNGPTYPANTVWEIAGVVDDIRARGLDQPVEPQIYFPLEQMPVEGLVYLLRTTLSPSEASGPTRSAVSSGAAPAWRATRIVITEALKTE
jgi:hypothetical protein